MDACSLIAELGRRGVELRAAGNRLQVRPADGVPPALMAELRAHGQALLRQLAGAQLVAEALGGVHEADSSILTEEVCSMQLIDFASAGLVVGEYSAVLVARIGPIPNQPCRGAG